MIRHAAARAQCHSLGELATGQHGSSCSKLRPDLAAPERAVTDPGGSNPTPPKFEPLHDERMAALMSARSGQFGPS